MGAGTTLRLFLLGRLITQLQEIREYERAYGAGAALGWVLLAARLVAVLVSKTSGSQRKSGGSCRAAF